MKLAMHIISLTAVPEVCPWGRLEVRGLGSVSNKAASVLLSTS